MQRVVSINLNGNVYQLEENGYDALFAYLDAADAQLKDDPDRAQKAAGLEARVAELCNALLSPHKTVVTTNEIDRILADLGPIPGQPTADTGRPAGAAGQTTSGTAGAEAGQPGPSWTPGAHHRRLYQIREGSMISGVCTGLAEYTRIDVTFIRILFVLFALMTGGWGIFAYAVLMFVVPRVETRADASAHDASGTMPPHRWPWDNGWPWDKHGWPWDKYGWPWDKRPQAPQGQPQTPDAQSQARDAPQQARDVQQQTQDIRQQARDLRQQARDARQQARAARREWRDERRAARMAYHPAGNFWGMFAMIICIVFAFFWLSLWTHGRLFFGWPYFWGFPHWVGLILFFMLIRLIFMPFRVPRYGYGYGYGYGPYAHPHYGWIAMWNGLAWFAFMIFGIWAAYHYVPEFRDFIRSFQTSWQDGAFHV
jgi:phage shock protein PspC (stress-responsive transcriptional regulator)